MEALKTLVRGEKARLDQLTPGSKLYVGLGAYSPGIVFGACCIGVDARAKLADERYFIFRNQPRAPEDAIVMLGPSGEDLQRYEIHLDRIPRWIERVFFTLFIEGRGKMEYLERAHLRLWDDAWEAARFPFDGTLFTHEKALIVGDMYRKDNVWRISAVAQGFHGGFNTILAHVGRSQIPQAAR